MNKTFGPVSLLHSALISVYSALLVVSVNWLRGGSWPVRLRLAYISRHYPHAQRVMDDSHGVLVAAWILVWGIAILAFCCLSLLSRFRWAKRVLNPLSGLLAVVGIPVAAMWTSGGKLLPFAVVEGLASVAFVFLYLYKNWPTSTLLRVILLTIHFGLWSWLIQGSNWPGWILLGPWSNWVWHFGDYFSPVYPLLGFCLAITWGCMSQTRANDIAVVSAFSQ